MRASIVRASITVEEGLLPDREDLMSLCTLGSLSGARCLLVDQLKMKSSVHCLWHL